jgi:DNA-binding transcriptional LysR family regulator
VVLLSRSTRGVTVSDAGRRLIPELEDLAMRLRHLRSAEREGEELALAAPSYLNAIFLPRIAAALGSEGRLRVRGLELPPAVVRAYAVENFFDLALVMGDDALPGDWVATRLGLVRKGLFATPAVAAGLGELPVEPDRLRAFPFVTPIYNVNGQFVPSDDGCPLGHGQRQLGHQSTTLVVGLDLACATGQLIFGPAIAAAGHIGRGQLKEIRVSGWDVREPLTMAANGARVKARTQRATAKLISDSLAELDPPRQRP